MNGILSALLNYGQQALVNLATAKLRAFLAVLGVLVGTAAVVALISCGQLATQKALEQFKTLGTDLLSVSVYQKEASPSGSGEKYLPLSFWQGLSEQIPAIKKVAPYTTAYQPISFQGRVLQGAIIGADEALASIIHIELARGRFVSFPEAFEHVCVIGHGLAEQVKSVSLEDLTGKQLRMDNTLYTIIGVAKPWKESGFFNEDINQSVIVPVAGMALINKNSQINNAVISLKTEDAIEEVIEQIRSLIQAQAPALTIFPRSARQIIASMESQGRIFTLLLAVIGSISLLVGGIGVMNVMLVSVSERKKEIGIRKAVGAKNCEIQALFLMESLMLSLLGGSLGVLAGLILTWVIAWFSSWPFSFYFLPPASGFAVSVATGIFFGFYPARRAARLQPMACLRCE